MHMLNTTQHYSTSSLPFSLPNELSLLIVSSVCALLLSFLLTLAVIKVAHMFGWLDRSTTERKRIHKKPVPRLGGTAIFLAFVVVSLCFYATNPELDGAEMTRYLLLLVAATLIVAVHAYDDVKGLKPLTKLLVQTLAVLILLGPSLIDMKFHGILLFGFSNPLPMRVPIHHPGLAWYQEPELTLFIRPADHQLPGISWLVIPAVLFTWFWMVGMMNTINFIDGVDGLATGVVAITGIFVAVISWTLQQHTIAILAAIFTGAVLGFLILNWHPAKIFMGDSGSQFLGMMLAALSILGGAKAALALMVLGIPILDVFVVSLNRIRRGQSFAHYDTKHLHHRLLATGLNARQICYVFYSLTLGFGLLALGLPRIYKILGIVLVVVTMAVLIVWIDYRQRRRGVPIKLDDSDPGLDADSRPVGEDTLSPTGRESAFQTDDSIVPLPDPRHARAQFPQ
ncbi:MAG TPA: MraY family glycosyltransferase [Ktedonobacteraceae bacterium]|nr:MraY family glycosyltransferase [Ktedonobacteraceae bacterium]